jgi:hypothetical protein
MAIVMGTCAGVSWVLGNLTPVREQEPAAAPRAAT